jgi:nucleotidyltransferase substrate binding protein (TIGR01987 family)
VKLDLSSLRKVISQLDQAMAYTDSAQAQANPQLRRVLQTAAIKAFEVAYELSWKMLKRHLEGTAAAAQSIDELAFPDLIRAGSEQGLLRSGWDVWKDFRKARNMTSHIYDEDKAAQVFALIPDFREEAVALLERLAQRHT